MEETNPDANPTSSILCNVCQTQFPSKTKLFQHLRRNSKNCIPINELSQSELKDFLKQECEKVIILYGYIPDEKYLNRSFIVGSSENEDFYNDNLVLGVNQDDCEDVRGGEDAARILADVIWELELDGSNTTKNDESNKKILRSYGNTSRGRDIINQEEYTSTLTELLCIKAPCITTTMENWIQTINSKLKEKHRIRVFGRKKVPKQFNPELHTTQRRSSYLLPADFLYTSEVQKLYPSQEGFFESLPTFLPGNNPSIAETKNITFDEESIYTTSTGRPNETTLPILYTFKKIMQKLCTQTQLLNVNNNNQVLEKEWAKRSRKKQKKKERRRGYAESNTQDKESLTNTIESNYHGKESTGIESNNQDKELHVLCRKRYHNFTKNVMAHEFLAYRRIDRFYHKGTLRFEDDFTLSKNKEARPYFLMTITGDQFLTGQIQGIIGLFLAIIHEYIPTDYIDCIFDEQYPHLLSVPFIPARGLYASDAMYSNWEGKLQCVLTPRQTSKKFEKEHSGSYDWNTDAFLKEVSLWEESILCTIAKSWTNEGESSDTLNAKTIWMDKILKPWSIKANAQLQEYRQWKQYQSIPPTIPDQVQKVIVPKLYQNVLYHLQQININKLWPTTTPKRQLVMVSTPATSTEQQSLSIAHFNAKSNDTTISPYSLQEGYGGASGSFSIGYTPDVNGTQQPKSNTLFPELVKSAFELEIALQIPNRKPSSTIAINRNAQFRPHLDSGIGTGQDISLIVGFGDYRGGELVIEKRGKIDIQYKPCEFDGWKERHWTMPFVGERYSLVWFTPKGCEGLKGIDLS